MEISKVKEFIAGRMLKTYQEDIEKLNEIIELSLETNNISNIKTAKNTLEKIIEKSSKDTIMLEKVLDMLPEFDFRKRNKVILG